MRKTCTMLWAAALLAAGAGTALAQTTASHDITITVNEVALLGLDDNTAVAFTLGAPAAPGAAFGVTASSGTIKYLQYTSIVPSGASRTITAEIDASLPDGLGINVAATDAANGCGTLGSSADIALGTTPVDIVTGIGSGYTGTGAADGVRLNYSLDAIDCTGEACLIFQDDTTVTVTYTLTDAA